MVNGPERLLADVCAVPCASGQDGTTKVHVDAIAAQVATGVKAATIRVWAHRGYLTRVGRDAKGRTLYDLDEIAERVGVDTGRQTV